DVATLELLERLGCSLEYPLDQTCCGQPLSNSGCQDDSAATEAHRAVQDPGRPGPCTTPTGGSTWPPAPTASSWRGHRPPATSRGDHPRRPGRAEPDRPAPRVPGCPALPSSSLTASLVLLRKGGASEGGQPG